MAKEPLWKAKKVFINVPICPECGNQLKKEKNLDARTLYHYNCENCDYKF